MRPSGMWAGLVPCATLAAPLPARTPSDSTFMVERTLTGFRVRAARNGSDPARLAGHPSGEPSSFCISVPGRYPAARMEELRDTLIARTGLPAAECVPVRQQMTNTTRTRRGYFDLEDRTTDFVTLRGPAVPTDGSPLVIHGRRAGPADVHFVDCETG